MTHNKRLPAPKHYPIQRKHGKYVSSIEGARSSDIAIPTVLFLRDVTGYADNVGDAKEIVRNGDVLRNGNPVRDVREGIGILDTVELPGAEECYRVLKHGDELAFIPVEDSDTYAAKIVEKRTDGDSFVYELHNGENYRSGEEYSTGNTLVFQDGDAREVVLEEGSEALVIDGKHAGEVAEVSEIHERGMNDDTALVESEYEFETQVENLVAVDGLEVGQ
jgi:ribosomal protein S4E